MDHASDIVEALVNLTYLICEGADHPEAVRRYASMSEERLTALINLLHATAKGTVLFGDEPSGE